MDSNTAEALILPPNQADPKDGTVSTSDSNFFFASDASSNVSTELSEDDDDDLSSNSRASVSIRRKICITEYLPTEYTVSFAKSSMHRKRGKSVSALKSSRTIENGVREVALGTCKLRFDRLNIYGREEEQTLLRQTLDRLAHSKEGKTQRELVVVRGEPGCGKTTLAVSALNHRAKRRGGAFAVGRFEAHHDGQPFAAIADACCQIWNQIADLKSQEEDTFNKITSHLRDKVGPEINSLLGVIPELSEILVNHDRTPDAVLPTQSRWEATETSWARLLLASQLFLETVAEGLSPLVLVVDDLQWSNTASLDLLENVLMNRHISKLMVVLLCRSDEVAETHPFSSFMRNLREKGPQVGFRIQEIGLGNLSIEAVNQILMELLSCDEPEGTLPLAKLCHRRTQGNVSLLLTFLRKLREENLLAFNLGSYRWNWDVEQILEGTVATFNVIEHVKRELLGSSRDMQLCLSIAACLGNSFEPKALRLALRASNEASTWQNGDHGERQGEKVESWLKVAVDSGIIEELYRKDKTVSYQWIHDEVRETALSFIPAETMPSLKGIIARQLWNCLPPADTEALLFIVANLMNDGPAPADPIERIEFADINLRAATKAVDASAFESAANYARQGIALLAEDRWESHYKLTLDLFTITAELEGGTGRFDAVEERYQEVSAQSLHLADKLRVYIVKAQQLESQIRHEEAAELMVKVLRKLNIKYPKRSAGRTAVMLSKVATLRKKCEALTLEALLNLPEMKDPVDLQIMKLLHQLAACTYRVRKNQILMPLAILTSAMLTFEKGTSVYSAPMFAQCGLLFSGLLRDIKLGGKMGSIAMNLMEQRQYKCTEANTIMITYSYCRPWVEPLGGALSKFTHGYKVGLLSGDVEASMLNILSYIIVGFQTGRPLRHLEHDCRIYIAQMAKFQRGDLVVQTIPYWLTFLRLMGTGDLAEPLEGYEPTLSFEDFLIGEDNEPNIGNSVRQLQSRLFATFDEHKKGADLAVKMGNGEYAKLAPGHFTKMPETFARALNLYSMAQRRKKRKYRVCAKQAHKKISKWKRYGNPNVVHYDTLLKAEESFLNGKYEVAEGLFQLAKIMASRSGYIQDAALATQRYGHMLMEMKSPEAAHKFEEAVKLYEEWGAMAKARQIRETYAFLWPRPSEITLPAAN